MNLLKKHVLIKLSILLILSCGLFINFSTLILTSEFIYKHKETGVFGLIRSINYLFFVSDKTYQPSFFISIPEFRGNSSSFTPDFYGGYIVEICYKKNIDIKDTMLVDEKKDIYLDIICDDKVVYTVYPNFNSYYQKYILSAVSSKDFNGYLLNFFEVGENIQKKKYDIKFHYNNKYSDFFDDAWLVIIKMPDL